MSASISAALIDEEPISKPSKYLVSFIDYTIYIILPDPESNVFIYPIQLFGEICQIGHPKFSYFSDGRFASQLSS